MRRRFRIRSLLLVFSVAAVFVIVMVWIIHSKARRDDLNQELVYAAQLGDVAEVKSLLEQGADPNAREEAGVQPANLLEWLRAWFVQGAIRRVVSRPVLFLAVGSRHPFEIVKLLVERGADVNAHCIKGTALSRAAQGGDWRTVAFLLEKGATVNTKDILGFTPLMYAVLSGKAEVVKMVLDRGADVNVSTTGFAVITGHVKDTALSFAQYYRSADIIKILKQAGAKE